jgi:signal transduction histidine kinase
MNQQIKILLIEDSLFATRHTQKMLDELKSPHFDVELKCCDCLSAGLKHAAKDGVDIVLLDLTLPDSNGLVTFKRLYKHMPQVPIVVMSGLEDEALAIEAVKKGAQDYLVKGRVDSNLLKRSILYAIERKRAEEELRKHREHLEELVEERTADLKTTNIRLQNEVSERKKAEEELKKTVADLERSNKELQQFAYVASHDLQEPLRVVASYVQLLSHRYKGQLDSDADDFINYAVEGVTRLQRQINDLLAFSRVRTKGREFKKIDCAHALDRGIANLQIAIEENSAVVTNDSLPRVNADESQIVKLFQNLIDNAIKFRSNKPPRVHISAKKKGKEWLFSVRDNGIGIDPQYAERIFVIFQRLHEREKYPGTGIGLAICKRIVERHGGRIWMESKPGKGSTFFFTIPAKRGR